MTHASFEVLAKRLDLHLLEPFWPADRVFEACKQARELQLRAVVVRPIDFELAAQWLAGSGIVVASTAGWPYGATSTAVKLYEGRDLLRQGVKELELYLSPARLLSRQFQHIEAELLQAAKSAHESGARLTVVYSSSHLDDDLRIITTKICRRTEVDVVSIDGGETELAIMKPLLKDVLQLKLATPAMTLDEVLTAADAGYGSIAVTDPTPIFQEWQARKEAEKAVEQTEQPVS